MKVSAEGRVTIPRHVRERLGLLAGTPVEWELLDGSAVLRKAGGETGRHGSSLVEAMRGRGSVPMTTDEIMALTRDG
jgi:AbrB family looped-hinge helix DNA binding protein